MSKVPSLRIVHVVCGGYVTRRVDVDCLIVCPDCDKVLGIALVMRDEIICLLAESRYLSRPVSELHITRNKESAHV